MNDADFFAGLVPELATLARLHREACHAIGLDIVFLEGRRTWAQQMDKYALGRARSADGWIVTDAALVVTHALPEQAPHCRGAAYDCAPLDQHDRIDWKRLDLFQAAAKVAPPALVWGGNFKKLLDMPHFELPDWRSLPMPAPDLS